VPTREENHPARRPKALWTVAASAKLRIDESSKSRLDRIGLRRLTARDLDELLR
jgi:hypothetical protein